MNKYKIAALITVGFLIGDATAITRANHRIKTIRTRHKRELVDARVDGYVNGSRAALDNPDLVSAAHKRLSRPTILDYSLN